MIARSQKSINCAMVWNLNDICLAAAALIFGTQNVSCWKEWHISKKHIHLTLYKGNIRIAVRSWLFFYIVAAKRLHCHTHLPEKLDDDDANALGLKTECRSRTTFCWKTETPAGIARGCGEDGFGIGFSMVFGSAPDSCDTLKLGGSYTGCKCHSDYCNTAAIVKINVGLISTVIIIFYILFPQMF